MPGRFPWLEGAAVRDVDPTSQFHEEHEATVREWLANRRGSPHGATRDRGPTSRVQIRSVVPT
jgi:hypothetical protein